MHAGDGRLVNIPEFNVRFEELEELDGPHLAEDEVLIDVRQVADDPYLPVAHAELRLELGGNDLGADIFQAIAVSSSLDVVDSEEWTFRSDFVVDDPCKFLVIMGFLLHLPLHLTKQVGIGFAVLGESVNDRLTNPSLRHNGLRTPAKVHLLLDEEDLLLGGELLPLLEGGDDAGLLIQGFVVHGMLYSCLEVSVEQFVFTLRWRRALAEGNLFLFLFGRRKLQPDLLDALDDLL